VSDASLPSVSVIVPVRDGARTIASCLDALLAQDYPGSAEVLVVDNGSTDATAGLVRPRDVLLVHESHQGRAIARNAGIARASGEIVAFVDADCIAEPGWLTALVQPFADAGVGGVGGEIHSVPPVTAVQVYLDRKEACWQQYCVQGGRRKRHGFLITANAAYRRSVLDEVGGFDPSFITAEDVDLGWRVRHAGHTLAYAPDAIVRHRLRETVRDLFRQRYGYGYGRVLFRRRHDLQRGYSLGTYRELGDATLRAVRLTVESARRPELADDASYARCETVERVALRLGAAHCVIAQVVPRVRLAA
jgi:cellulose synthase/poly-beta-1,6-N-acetylglucosamine synthase-like glycosyltransferase